MYMILNKRTSEILAATAAFLFVFATLSSGRFRVQISLGIGYSHSAHVLVSHSICSSRSWRGRALSYSQLEAEQSCLA